MKEYPINFKDWEIRAILDGRKTQFRRIIKPQPAEGLAWRGIIYCSTTKAHEGMHSFTDQVPCVSQAQRIRCPYGQPGDRMLVRGSYPKSIRITELLLLETESVRVERLRDISEDGATAEGCDPLSWFAHCWRKFWAANPWVWVVEFRVVEGGHE